MVLVAFMLLRLLDLRERVIRLLGPRNLQATTAALDDAAGRVSRYLLSQLLINSLTGLWVGVGLCVSRRAESGPLGRAHPGAALHSLHRVWMAGVVPFALSFCGLRRLGAPPDRRRHLWQHRALQLRGARAVALRRADRCLAGGAAARRRLLDLALGTRGPAALGAHHGVSGRHGQVRPAARVPRGAARRRAGPRAASASLSAAPHEQP